ncbi:prepilin peptidase [Nocardia camponoti]|uniref:Prepilin type IV endopeptidase peptidase domain-containing protein n=1 Tax=Nocardia camponoti TaxID=1616106 RepID=A0A917QAC0_9NOCA|nr:A24 family peptidase [Nocardia camponoti]GGK39498.1 hypothetical protein GCM10011591_08960 [Nocardia camponoti]
MTTAAFCLFIAWSVLLCVIDIHTRRLPNALTSVGAASVFVFAFANDVLPVAVIGAALLTVPYLTAHLIAPAALGAGDVKLAVALGGAAALAGPRAWVWAALLAPLVTAGLGVALLAHRWVVRVVGLRSGVAVDLPVASHDGASQPEIARADDTGAARMLGRPSARDPVRTPILIPHGPAMCVATLSAMAFA